MTNTVCPRCQSSIPANRTASACPVCLLQLAVGEPSADLSEELAPTIAPKTAETAPEIAELAPHFPQIEILDLIGQGGMGSVYRVRQRALNRIVALKILAQNLAQDTGFAERFQREAQTLAQLNHPSIVTIHEAGKNGPHYYLLMEYVEGTDLRNAMRAQSLTPVEALEIIQQVCSALQYAHEHEIVHRDVKPENILLDKTGKVKIADFGLAKLLRSDNTVGSLTHTHQVMGTLHYMAPEQHEKPLSVDHRADIYSLGVVFYEILTGHLPVGHFKAPSIDSGVDARLDEVVLRALERKPEERYQSAKEVRQKVQHISGCWAESALPLVPEMAIPTHVTKPESQSPRGSGPITSFETSAIDRILASFNLGPILFGAVMGGLGIVLLTHTALANETMTWVGLSLSIGGLATIAHGFSREQKLATLTFNPGPFLCGFAYLLLGLSVLVDQGLSERLFTWIGIGIMIAGGSYLSSGCSHEGAIHPMHEPKYETLIWSLGLLLFGTILLIFKNGIDNSVMTWIGLGMYLFGASTLSDVWSIDEPESQE